MIRIIISLLMIILIIGEGIALYQIHFNQFISNHSWYHNVFQNAISYCNQIKISSNTSRLIFNDTFNELDKISYKLEELKIDISSGHNITKFKRNHNLYIEHIYSRLYKCIAKLNNSIHRINDIYDNVRSRVLIENHQLDFDILTNLSNDLRKIRKIVFVSKKKKTMRLIRLIMKSSKLLVLYQCDTNVSTQQFMFFIYHTLIITEMKIFAVLTYVFSTHFCRNKNVNHSQYLKNFQAISLGYISNYAHHFRSVMMSVSRDIHRCNLYSPVRGVNFLEFVNYDRAQLVTTAVLGTKYLAEDYMFCDKKCENINYTYVEKIMSMRIYNVTTIGKSNDIQVCPVNTETPYRECWWWKTHDNIIYGRNVICPNILISGSWDTFLKGDCNICLCSVIQIQPRQSHDILRISALPQLSDISNDMFIVGVKFIASNNIIYLQIQQSKILTDDKINIRNFTSWKEINDDYKNINNHNEYNTLGEFSGQLYLDDIMLPPSYVLTGIQFRNRKNYPEGIFLSAHGTPLNLITGKLEFYQSKWFVADNMKYFNRSDYIRNRIEIQMNDPDDPIQCSDYNYDHETNKYIRFRHSSVIKDAGQTTVPYIDAQSVETYPSFPLSGIGLFYREKIGCGGYVAPRIFTYDLANII